MRTVIDQQGNTIELPEWAFQKAFGVSARTPSFLARARSYVKAELSPRLDDDATRARLDRCQDQCQKSPDEHCPACGCGKWGRAQLQVKARMSAAKCPLGLWPKR